MTDSLDHYESAAAAGASPEPDVHGQAAYLLTESLIHGLIANRTLTLDQAIEIVEVAAEVKVEVAPRLNESPTTIQQSLNLLIGMAESLRSDLRQ